MNSALEIVNLSVTFPAKPDPVLALDGISFTVDAGQVFGFLGPNGAGKTTTMMVLLGFIEATNGEARIFGKDVRKSIARTRIGYLPERPDMYPFLTGAELLNFTGKLFRIKRNELLERIDAVLDKVEMADAANKRIATYSRGMLQRISMAQALINNPDLVILDEPTGGLDPLGRAAIRDIINGLRKDGKTVFFSSHELSEVEMVCDHLAILAKGRIVAEGAAKDLVKPNENLERFFMRTIGGQQ